MVKTRRLKNVVQIQIYLYIDYYIPMYVYINMYISYGFMENIFNTKAKTKKCIYISTKINNSNIWQQIKAWQQKYIKYTKATIASDLEARSNEP